MITEPEHLNCIKYFNLLKRLLGEGLVALDWEKHFLSETPCINAVFAARWSSSCACVCVCANACICVCLFL